MSEQEKSAPAMLITGALMFLILLGSIGAGLRHMKETDRVQQSVVAHACQTDPTSL